MTEFRDVRYVQVSDGAYIAYLTVGDGPVDIVWQPEKNNNVDIVWQIPGHHPLAGRKQGITEVLAFFDQLGKADFKAQPLVIAEQGDYVIDHHRGWSTKGSGSI